MDSKLLSILIEPIHEIVVLIAYASCVGVKRAPLHILARAFPAPTYKVGTQYRLRSNFRLLVPLDSSTYMFQYQLNTRIQKVLPEGSNSDVVFFDEGKEDPNITKSHHLPPVKRH